MKFCVLHDEYLQIRHQRIDNKWISCVCSFLQVLITTAALCQHIYSLIIFKGEILHCGFNVTKADKDYEPFLAADIIIFDIGLFHVLWGIDMCIANYLDGGYMRFAWCVGHTSVLCSFLVISIIYVRPKPILLWPMLCQQSVYGIGLLILSLSALPKLLPTFLGSTVKGGLFVPMLVYIMGASLNFTLLYIFWHYYWFVEADYKAERRKNRELNNSGGSTSRDDEDENSSSRRFLRHHQRFTFVVESPQ